MITVSLCLIVKNEAHCISQCLDSVKDVFDEIIVVDTGSTDTTIEIARRYTGKIYSFEWINDFSAARNFSFAQATMDYIMWLDADDILPPAEREKLLALKNTTEPDTDIIMMNYHTHFDESGNATTTTSRERMLRRATGFLWNDPVHEYITPSGKIVKTDIAVYHIGEPDTTGRNLKIYESMISSDALFSPRSLYYYARELVGHKRYYEAAKQLERFLDEGGGWVEDCVGACFLLGKCCKENGEHSRRISALLRSMEYDLPHPEICCEIGYYFKESEDYVKAVFWYSMALAMRDTGNEGFVMNECRGFIPNIELCVCYSALGDNATASKHNEMAAKFKPDSPAVIHNRQYFSAVDKKTLTT